MLYFRIFDPEKASYGIDDPYDAVQQLAQSTLRSEIGKLKLDKTFEERDSLNQAVVDSINKAAEKDWGIRAMRHEIKNIQPPRSVISAMELQVSAERTKRAVILESEGKREATVNAAESEKSQVVLNSEAMLLDQVNRGGGRAGHVGCCAGSVIVLPGVW